MIRTVDLGFVDYSIMKNGSVFTVVRAYWYDMETLGQFSSRASAHRFLNNLLG